MGSKAPPPGTSWPSDSQEGETVGLPLPASHATKITSLQRIAEALQVPPAALYQLPNAVEAAKPIEQTESPGGQDRECYALIQAFMRISDPEERRRILALVQASAERA
ncbi:hypothetical protein [Methylobacterium sp. J-092]|uniref:hypothetical protein n=1 Tax=Methylobacterium sp. J-092 TaxID=2836667 RepID=UPI001FBB419B|nr:hypothetical protein [Methylobacterium sp. J-092]MCJ2005630.1 hypothetical protein [Methylobacterium sp. J-092]